VGATDWSAFESFADTDSNDAMSVHDVAVTGFVALLDIEAVEHKI
jgi:hypothetical protein